MFSAVGVVPRVRTGLLAAALVAGVELSGLAQQPVFRTSVEVIAVDVQVMDKDGTPIGQIDPHAFDVTISGKRHKVTSATFIRHTEAPSAAFTRKPADLPALPPDDSSSPTLARTVILAVDAGSFEPGDSQAAMNAARGFIRQLDPTDRLGLYIYPSKVWIAPTTQRAAPAVRLENLVGEKEPLRSYYNLTPHEIVDITAQSTNPNSFLTNIRNQGVTTQTNLGARSLDPVLKIAARECSADELDCPIKIYSEEIGRAHV